MQTTQMYEKGVVMIPKQVRDSAGLRPGMELEAIPTERGVLLEPAQTSIIWDLHNRLARGSKEIDFHKVRDERIKKHLAKAGFDVHRR